MDLMMVRYVEIVESINKDHIEKILDEHFTITGHHTIDDAGFITVNGLCRLDEVCQQLPVKFRSVQGSFICMEKQLISLNGCPKICGVFSCVGNNLTNLIGAPDIVQGTFLAHENNLETLEGLPKIVHGQLWLPFLPNLPMLRLVGRRNDIIFKNGEEYNYELADIFQKYKNKSSRIDILNCQKDLINSGFEGNASW